MPDGRHCRLCPRDLGCNVILFRHCLPVGLVRCILKIDCLGMRVFRNVREHIVPVPQAVKTGHPEDFEVDSTVCDFSTEEMSTVLNREFRAARRGRSETARQNNSYALSSSEDALRTAYHSLERKDLQSQTQRYVCAAAPAVQNKSDAQFSASNSAHTIPECEKFRGNHRRSEIRSWSSRNAAACAESLMDAVGKNWRCVRCTGLGT